jgi:alpha-ketoglutarate-dependent taurine dioxygenase
LKIRLPQPNQPQVIIESDKPQDQLRMLDTQQIKALYIEHGAILFRGFCLNIAEFSEFSNRFCSNYVSNKSPGREVLSSDGRVQTVNLGSQYFPLHPEISREPWQPDIAWFACQQPSRLGGETTICDGVRLAKALSPELHKHLLHSSLAHTLPTDLKWCSAFLGKDELQANELESYSDQATFQFNVSGEQISRTYLRPMLHKPMFCDEWAYGSFLVFARQKLQVRDFPCYADGSEVSDALVDEIETISNRLATAIKWLKDDVLMLDNTRFMHGRNPIGDPQSRRILTQFGYLSFVPDDYPDLAKQTWRVANQA